MGHINSTTIHTDWERGKNLNFKDKCSIKVFHKLKYFMRWIANELNCSPSTIIYELSNLEKYRVLVYFSHPYSFWEQPQNERWNRIFRRFVPKGMSIYRYSAEQILEYADSMNSLPRNILVYMTPGELFEAF